jgi:hypothetical protein
MHYQRYSDPDDPAFPGHHAKDEGHRLVVCHGMTMREWYAGQALSAIIHSEGAWHAEQKEGIAAQAGRAFAYADAMLQEAKKGGSA